MLHNYGWVTWPCHMGEEGINFAMEQNKPMSTD